MCKFLILYFTCNLLIICTLGRRTTHLRYGWSPITTQGRSIDAILYEKDVGSGMSVSYKHNTKDLYNLKYALDRFENHQMGKLCVWGEWLLYPEPGFATSSYTKLQVISGDNRCVTPPSSMRSLQSIGKNSPLYMETITFFKEANLAGEATAVTESVSSERFKYLVSQTNSFAVTGQSNWTLVVDFSQTICVTVNTPRPIPICFMPTFEHRPFDKIFEVRKGCDPGSKINGFIVLTECIDFGSGLVENITLSSIPRIGETSLGFVRPEGRGLLGKGNEYSGRALNRIQRGSSGQAGRTFAEGAEDDEGDCHPPPDDPLTTKMCNDLIDMRINQRDEIVLEDTNFKLPSDLKNVWKVDLLETTMEILLATCPPPVVNPEYVKLLQEVFIYHLDGRWNETVDRVEEITEEDYRDIVSVTNKCLKSRMKRGFDMNVAKALDKVHSTQDLYKGLIEHLSLDWSRDTIVEFIWLAANGVATICQRYGIDFRANYITAFNAMYLNIIKEQWEEPGDYMQRCYNHVLGGFDMAKQYNRLRVCVETRMIKAGNIEPFSREWSNEITRKK